MARSTVPLRFSPLIVVLLSSACTQSQGETPSNLPEGTRGDSPFATLELEAVFPEGLSYLSGVRELSDAASLVSVLEPTESGRHIWSVPMRSDSDGWSGTESMKVEQDLLSSAGPDRDGVSLDATNNLPGWYS